MKQIRKSQLSSEQLEHATHADEQATVTNTHDDQLLDHMHAIDEVLDAIDTTLSEQAQAYVSAYVQQVGQ